MDIIRYFLDHYVMLTELTGLVAMVSLGVHLSKETTKATRIAILLIILESVIWSAEGWTQDNPGLEIIRAMLTSSIYCLHPIIVVAIIAMVAPIRTKKRRIVLIAPLMVYVPLVFTSQWTHIIFYIDEKNRWIGTEGLRYMPYAFFMSYTLIFILLFIRRYRLSDRRTLSAVIYIIAAGIVGAALNIVRDNATDYATLFSSVIVLYYLFLYMYMSKSDPLTGMQNRQTFYHDIDTANGKYSAVCSVDMNELKWINDTNGHEAGDIALKAVGNCLMINTGTDKKAYRVGGDEFIIFYSGKNEEEIRRDIELMREALAKTDYVCAFGYCMVSRGMDLEKAIVAADKAMYTDKARLKQAVLASGGILHMRADD